jgi:hypothetical protein
MDKFIPRPELGFKIAEPIVRHLLHSYFVMFANPDLLELSRKLGLGVSYFRIPIEYLEQGRLIANLDKLPIDFLEKNLFYSDRNAEAAPFQHFPTSEPENWNIFIFLNHGDTPPPQWTGLNIDDLINGTLVSSIGVFQFLKKTNTILSTIELKLENKTVHLFDLRFPNYNHDHTISYTLQRECI